jgi:hypothetical protein
MTCHLSIALIFGLLGQASPPTGDSPADSKARLEFMKKSMASNDIRALDDVGTKFRLQAEPVLRFTNPVGGSKDGAMFLWLGEADRLVVASQLLLNPQRIWAQELSSLATTPFEATAADGSLWKPSKVGVSFQPVPGAPKPADTAEHRLRQMRELAEEFSAEHCYRGTTWNQLRLLTKPFARYGKPSSDVQDGALFCFAHGTDPEVLLMLEMRSGQVGPEWQYAFAPMTGFATTAYWKGKEIWKKPMLSLPGGRDPSSTFHFRRISTETGQ